MRLPALAIAVCYAGGIALGLSTISARHAESRLLLVAVAALAMLLIALGFALAARDLLVPALCVALLGWLALGAFSVIVAEAAKPANHITELVAKGAVELHAPLRWHARLRDEPTPLLWGYGYELELQSVDLRGEAQPVRGGMRLSYTPREGGSALPELHAGDDVSVVTEARLPQVFRDDGAFDRRAYLAQQGIDVTATLRAPELLERTGTSEASIGTRLAHVRRGMREKLNALFVGRPEIAATLRAMLLGDRTFVDRTEAEAFQKTGAFHLLVVAGLHVGAFAAVLFWLGRRLRVNVLWTATATIVLLLAYVAIVEQRPPVLRATLMAGLVVLARIFYRRLELLNTAGLAALVLLIAHPVAIRDSSFQLTFAAVGCIAGLALPWLEQTVQPYARALRGWRDVTRDAAHEPRAAQFRIDLRAAAAWLTRGMRGRIKPSAQDALVGTMALTLRSWELFVLTLALQIGMLPWMASDFHRITLSGPFVNLAAVPLTGAIVPLGFVTLIVAWIFVPFARALAAVLGGLTALLLRVIGWFAAMPHWSYRIPGPPLWLFLAFCALALLMAVTLRFELASQASVQNWLRRSLAGALVCAAVLIAAYPFPPRWSPGKLELAVLDVGQGDSLLVVSPRGRTMLIDGGGAFAGFAGHLQTNGIDPGEDAVSPYLWSRGFQRINIVALTHAHQDHLGGLKAVLKNFAVGELWIGREITSAPMQELERLARERDIPICHEFHGRRFDWDGASGEFLWPEARLNSNPEATNDDSLVLRIRFRDREFLLPGDAERRAESEILRENDPGELRADVLKVGHHGSRNSTLPDWLAAVQPRIAIISVGEVNPYGHPSPELLARLEEAHVRMLRTDRDGAVDVLTDGQNLEVSCYVSCLEGKTSDSVRQAQAPDQSENRKQE
jgi:competence protein ComEC